MASATSQRPAGPWLHSFMVACITASIELATLSRDDTVYIPQSAILARAGAALRYPTRFFDPAIKRMVEKDLIPDALFGLEYKADAGSRYRFFAVEADRATEPATSTNVNRKSILRNLRQYAAYVEQGGNRAHLGLTAPMLVLNVISDAARMAQMMRVVERQCPVGNAYMLFQCWTDFGVVLRPPKPNDVLLTGVWQRCGVVGFGIDRS